MAVSDIGNSKGGSVSSSADDFTCDNSFITQEEWNALDQDGWDNFLYNAQTENIDFYLLYTGQAKPTYNEAFDAWNGTSSYSENVSSSAPAPKSTPHVTTAHAAVIHAEPRVDDSVSDVTPTDENIDSLLEDNTCSVASDEDEPLDHIPDAYRPGNISDKQDTAMALHDVVERFTSLVGFLIQPMFRKNGALNLEYFSVNGFVKQDREPWYGLMEFFRSQFRLLDGASLKDPYSDLMFQNSSLLTLVASYITGDAEYVVRSEATYRREMADFERAFVSINPYKFVDENLDTPTGRHMVERVLYRAVNENWGGDKQWFSDEGAAYHSTLNYYTAGWSVRDQLIDAVAISGAGIIDGEILGRIKSPVAETRTSAVFEGIRQIKDYYNNVTSRHTDQFDADKEGDVSYTTFDSSYTVATIRSLNDTAAKGVDIKSKLIATLSSLWMFGTNNANWADFSYPGINNETIRRFIVYNTDRFLGMAERLKTESDLVTVTEDIQDFINTPLYIDGALFGSVLTDILKAMPKVVKEPYTSFVFYADKLSSSIEMGEHLNPVQNFTLAYVAPPVVDENVEISEDAPLPELDLTQPIQNLIGALQDGKMELYKYYRDQGYLTRGFAQAASLLGDGDLVYIQRAQDYMDALVGRLTQAKDQKTLQNIIDDLYVSLAPGGEIAAALNMLLGPEKAAILNVLQFAATGLAAKLVIGVAFKVGQLAIAGTAATETTATAAAVASQTARVTVGQRIVEGTTRAVQAGASTSGLVLANSTLDSASGTGSQRHATYSEWGTQALSSGVAGVLTGFAPLASGSLLKRYALADDVMYRLVADQAIEMVEEPLDDAINRSLKGDRFATAYDFSETLRSTSLGGFAKVGAVRELMESNHGHGEGHANQDLSHDSNEQETAAPVYQQVSQTAPVETEMHTLDASSTVSSWENAQMVDLRATTEESSIELTDDGQVVVGKTVAPETLVEEEKTPHTVTSAEHVAEDGHIILDTTQVIVAEGVQKVADTSRSKGRVLAFDTERKPAQRSERLAAERPKGEVVSFTPAHTTNNTQTTPAVHEATVATPINVAVSAAIPAARLVALSDLLAGTGLTPEVLTLVREEHTASMEEQALRVHPSGEVSIEKGDTFIVPDEDGDVARIDYQTHARVWSRTDGSSFAAHTQPARDAKPLTLARALAASADDLAGHVASAVKAPGQTVTHVITTNLLNTEGEPVVAAISIQANRNQDGSTHVEITDVKVSGIPPLALNAYQAALETQLSKGIRLVDEIGIEKALERTAAAPETAHGDTQGDGNRGDTQGFVMDEETRREKAAAIKAKKEAVQKEVAEIARGLIDYKRGLSLNPFRAISELASRQLDKMTITMSADADLLDRVMRFTDVLPEIENDPQEVVSHFKDYFPKEMALNSNLPGPLRLAINMAHGGIPSQALSFAIQRGIRTMAYRYISATSAKNAATQFREMAQSGMMPNADIVGEAITSTKEESAYLDAYMDLIDRLAGDSKLIEQTRANRKREFSVKTFEEADQYDIQISLKFSSLYSQWNPADPEGTAKVVKDKFRQVLDKVLKVEVESGVRVGVTIDLEQFEYRDLTYAIFKEVLAEEKYAGMTNVGIVVQAYLQDSESVLRDLAAWSKARGDAQEEKGNRRSTVLIRLVKGAYWDYENLQAAQKGFDLPVFSEKSHSDGNYEEMVDVLMSEHQYLRAAIGSHNARTMAYAIYRARSLSVPMEAQMLFGMANDMKEALVGNGIPLSVYSPVGELLPGMAYLARRILENSSQKSFLLQRLSGRSVEDLVQPPDIGNMWPPKPLTSRNSAVVTSLGEPFVNEPLTDYSRPENQEKLRNALEEAKVGLQQRLETGFIFEPVVAGETIRSSQTENSVNPSQPSQILGKIALADREAIKAAFDSAENAVGTWGNDTRAEERSQKLLVAAKEMRLAKFQLTAILMLEAGKLPHEADAEVAEAIDFLEYYAREALRLRDENPDVNIKPKGVATAIAPWNFPLAILTGMSAAALVEGNSTVIKPSRQTSILGYAVYSIYRKAGIDADAVHFVPSKGSDFGKYLAEEHPADVIAFTGSKETGLQLYETQAPHGVKVIAEMGGKNAMIIDRDAHPDEVIKYALGSKFGYGGQKCSALDRLIIVGDEAHFRHITDRLVEAAQSLKVGNVEDFGNTYGPVIDEESYHRLIKLITNIEETRQGRILLDGRPTQKRGDGGYFINPTLVEVDSAQVPLMQDENFGPVLAIMRVDTLDAAIQVAKDSEFNLTGAVITRSPASQAKVLEHWDEVGNLYINRGTTGAVVARQPFGGNNNSGIGGSKAGGRNYLSQFVTFEAIDNVNSATAIHTMAEVAWDMLTRTDYQPHLLGETNYTRAAARGLGLIYVDDSMSLAQLSGLLSAAVYTGSEVNVVYDPSVENMVFGAYAVLEDEVRGQEVAGQLSQIHLVNKSEPEAANLAQHTDTQWVAIGSYNEAGQELARLASQTNPNQNFVRNIIDGDATAADPNIVAAMIKPQTVSINTSRHGFDAKSAPAASTQVAPYELHPVPKAQLVSLKYLLLGTGVTEDHLQTARQAHTKYGVEQTLHVQADGHVKIESGDTFIVPDGAEEGDVARVDYYTHTGIWTREDGSHFAGHTHPATNSHSLTLSAALLPSRQDLAGQIAATIKAQGKSVSQIITTNLVNQKGEPVVAKIVLRAVKDEHGSVKIRVTQLQLHGIEPNLVNVFREDFGIRLNEGLKLVQELGLERAQGIAAEAPSSAGADTQGDGSQGGNTSSFQGDTHFETAQKLLSVLTFDPKDEHKLRRVAELGLANACEGFKLAANETEAALNMVLFLSDAKNNLITGEERTRLETHFVKEAERLLAGRSAEEVVTSNWERVALYYNKRAELGLDDFEGGRFERPQSAWDAKKVGALFAGQANDWLAPLRFLYKTYPEARRFIEREGGNYLSDLTRKIPDVEPGRQIDVVRWINDPASAPGSDILNAVDVSSPGIGLFSLTLHEVLKLRIHLDAATGFSQGITPALHVAGGLTAQEAIRDLTYQGQAYRQSDPGYAGNIPMRSVWGISEAGLKKFTDAVKRELGDDHQISVSPNTDWTHTITGTQEGLAALKVKIDKANEGKDDKHSEYIKFLDTTSEGRFHHPLGMAHGDSQLATYHAQPPEGGMGIRVASQSLSIPVFSTLDAADLRTVADPLARTITDRGTSSFHFPKQCKALADAGVDVVIGFGPGTAVDGMARKNLAGTGIQIISAADENFDGLRALFTTDAAKTKPAARYDSWQVVKLPDGTEIVQTDFNRAYRGEVGSFIQIGAMTPHTGDIDTVTRIALEEGMLTGLSSGSWGTRLPDAIRSVATVVGREVAWFTNLMAIWGGFDGQVSDAIKGRQEHDSPVGVEVTAGMPKDLPAFIKKAHAAGIPFPQFKIGSPSQVADVVAVLKAQPELTQNGHGVVVVLENKVAGGHHGAHSVQELWGRGFDDLQKAGAIVVDAGGLFEPALIARAMIHGRSDGLRDLPAASVIVASGAQNFDVMKTTDGVRSANVAATSKTVGTLPSQASGPQHVVQNEYFARCGRLEALVNSVRVDLGGGKFRFNPWSADQKAALIAEFNSSQTKPWFWMRGDAVVEPTSMTFGDVLNRWVDLSLYDDKFRPPYPEFYNTTFVAMQRAMDEYLAPQTGRTAHTVAADANFTDPGQVRAQARAFIAGLGKAAEQPISEEFLSRLGAIWHRAGEFQWNGSEAVLVFNHFPQRFVFGLDAGQLVADYKSGQTQYALYEQGYDANQLLIQTGPEVADQITEANIPIADWHRAVMEATVAEAKKTRPTSTVGEVSEPGAKPYVYSDMAKVSGVSVSVQDNTEGGQKRTFVIDKASRVDADAYLEALMNQGTGDIRTALDVRFRHEEGGQKVKNDLSGIFKPRDGQVVVVETNALGQTTSIRIHDNSGEPSTNNLRVKFELTGESTGAQTRLTVSHSTFDGRSEPFVWEYTRSRHHGFMTKLEERFVDPYETYARLFGSSQPDESGVYRGSYTVTRDDLVRFRNAMGGQPAARESRTDASGKLTAPLTMVARFGSAPWTAAAFKAVEGGSPINLRHVRDSLQFVADGLWVQEGDTVESEARIVGETTDASGRKRFVEASTYVVRGDERILVAKSRSEFLTLGHFSDASGFDDQTHTFYLKADNPFLRAILKAHDVVRGVTLHDGVKIVDNTELKFDLSEKITVDASGATTSRLSGNILDGDKIVGTVDRTDTFAKGEKHPFLQGHFFNSRKVTKPDYAAFAPGQPVLFKREKTSLLEPAVYSRASGDINPIHDDVYIAAKMGQDHVINHGMWTKASAMATLVASPVVGGNPARILKETTTMMAEVKPGTKLTDTVEEIGARDGRILVRVKTTMADPADASKTKTVLEMIAEVAQPRTAYALPGQGDQKPGMFAKLLAEPAGKAMLERLDRHTRAKYGFSIIAMVGNPDLKELSFVPVEGRGVQTPVKHPEHVIHRTELSQMALGAHDIATAAVLQAKGLYQEDAVLIGNSRGEYVAAYMAGKISAEDLLDMFYMRGMSMQRFVDPLRDADGKSPFRMDAIAYYRNDFDQPDSEDPTTQVDIRKIVEDVRRDTGKFVQLANFNRPTQTTVTGEIDAVEEVGRRIDAAHKQVMARLGRPFSSVITKLPIDTPFHSQVLAFGIPEFWRVLTTTPIAEGHSLDSRYVPCIHGEVFRVTPEYIDSVVAFINRYAEGLDTDAFKATAAMMQAKGFDSEQLLRELRTLMGQHLVDLHEFRRRLEAGTADRVEVENYLLRVGLVYQFAAPVEWVKVQMAVFEPAGAVRAERLIEIAPASTIKDHASSTTDKKLGARRVLIANGKGPQFLTTGAVDDWNKIIRHVEAAEEAPATVAAPSNPAPGAGATPPPADAAPARAAAPVAAGNVPDKTITALDILRTIVAMERKVRVEEVDVSKTLETLMGGSDKAIPVANDGIKPEFPGATVPDNAHKSLSLTDLAGAIGGGAAFTTAGPTLKKYFKAAAARLTGVPDDKAAQAHFLTEWADLPAGRRLEAMMLAITASREGTSNDTGKQLADGDLALTGNTDGKAWLDKLLGHYRTRESIPLASAKEKAASGGGEGGGVKVDMKKLHRDRDLSIAFRFLADSYPGLDEKALTALFAELESLRGQVAEYERREAVMQQIRDKLGDRFADSLTPAFDADKMRSVHSQFVDSEVTDWIFGQKFALRAGTSVATVLAEQATKMARMANRATTRTLALLRYQRAQVAEELAAIASSYPQLTRLIADEEAQVVGRSQLVSRLGAIEGLEGAAAKALAEHLAQAGAEVQDHARILAHAKDFLADLTAYGATARPELEAWDQVLARMETLVADQTVDPTLSGDKLMNPNGAMKAPVARPDVVWAGSFTRPRMNMGTDGKITVKEVARPGFTAADMVTEFREGGTLTLDGESRHVDYLSGPDRNLVLEAADDFIANGRTYQTVAADGSRIPEVALMIGASLASINIDNFKAFAAGGAHIIVTTSKEDYNVMVRTPQWGEIPLIEFYERTYHEHRGRGAKLEFASLNVGSDEDVEGFKATLKVRKLYPRYVYNFAAWPLSFDTHLAAGKLGGKASGDGLATFNVNYKGLERVRAALVSNMREDGVTSFKIIEVLAGSPNKHLLPGGEYGDVQAAKEAYVNAAESDPSLKDYYTVADQEHGWIRTGLMDENGKAAEGIEAIGVRTHAPAEAAFLDVVLSHPIVMDVAANRPVRVSTEAGFLAVGPKRMLPVRNEIVGDVTDQAEMLKAIAEAGAKDGRLKPTDSIEVHTAARRIEAPAVHRRATDAPLDIPLEQTVVVVSADRIVGGGDRATTRALAEMGSVKRLDDESIMRLAALQNIVKWDSGRGRYVVARNMATEMATVSEVAAKAALSEGAPINAKGVRDIYGDWMNAHVGIRQIEPDLHYGFNPRGDKYLMKIVSPEARTVRGLDSTQLRQLMSEGDQYYSDGEGTYTLVKNAGSVDYFWAEKELDRQLAGQVPTGWDPVAEGMPRAYAGEVSRSSNLLIRATAGALAAIGLTPEAIEADPVLSIRTGLAMGTGLADQTYARLMQTLGLFDENAPGGMGKPIVDGLGNMPQARVAMNYLRNFTGPKNLNVAACGTTAESMATAIFMLITGEVDVVMMGGVETPVGQGATKRFAEIDATQTIDYLRKLGVPENQAANLVFSTLANGFVPGEGAGVAVLTRGDVAFERGWPVEGIALGVGNASGGQAAAAASPDRGAITRLPYLLDAYGKPFGLTPNQIMFHETHGTGTVQGDANDLKVAYLTAMYAGLREAGNLYPANAPKGVLVGHTMGQAALDGIIEGLDMFLTGRFPARAGLQTVNPIVDAKLHHLMMTRFGFQVDPATLDAFAFSSYGFGKENFEGVMLNGSRYWQRMVMGRYGRAGWTAYQGRLERTMGAANDLQGAIRTGRRPLITMNDAVTKGKPTDDTLFDNHVRRSREWIAANPQASLGYGRPR
ncbi:proline dehydrogenase family protein [bacterium]|nr:proline dehydrogenase family protein [bacterium]